MQFADWWRTTAGDRFIKVPAAALGHSRFWDAMHTVTLAQLTEIEHRLALRMVEVLGKRVLVTDREHWSIAEVVAGYRSQSEAEFTLRQLKDPHVVSFSPMHHWTEHNIRVHTFTCVLALQLAHLMRREAKHSGLHLSVRELLDTLPGIRETVLICPSTGGRPKARRMLTETSPTRDQLSEIFDLTRWAPRTEVIGPTKIETCPEQRKHHPRSN